MPELPEVETSCRGIAPHCIGSNIVKIDVRQAKLRWPVDPEISPKMCQKLIINVKRRGKYLLLKFAELDLMIHLGMSGSLRILEQYIEPDKHDHVDIFLSNGKLIRYNDPRRFGSILLNNQGLAHPLLANLGPEPLEDSFNADFLYESCRQRKVSIKSLIMNSQIVVGVGNIYAQEALFRAGIAPHRAANKIAKKRMIMLVEVIKAVLLEAIKAGGSSLKDFTSADGKPGYFQHTHQVYGRAGEPCHLCQKPLKQKVIAQRTTTYCSSCQK